MFDLRTAFFVVIDLETTGLDPERDRVCEVGAIKILYGKEQARFHSLIQPGCPMPDAARTTHGITEAMLREAPPFGRIARELRQFMSGSVIVAQNAEFDMAFLNAEFVRSGMARLALPAVDTIPLARLVKPGLASYGLDTLVLHFKVPLRDRHRSIGDCEATGDIFWKCVEILRPKTMEELLEKGKLPPARPESPQPAEPQPGLFA